MIFFLVYGKFISEIVSDPPFLKKNTNTISPISPQITKIPYRCFEINSHAPATSVGSYFFYPLSMRLMLITNYNSLVSLFLSLSAPLPPNYLIILSYNQPR